MKHVVRYLLEGDGSVPSFISSGGYFILDEELVGVSVDDSKRYLPSTVVKLTKAELVTRILATKTDEDGNPLDQAGAEAVADAWLSEYGMGDYE